MWLEQRARKASVGEREPRGRLGPGELAVSREALGGHRCHQLAALLHSVCHEPGAEIGGRGHWAALVNEGDAHR